MSKFLSFALDEEHLKKWNWLVNFYNSKTGLNIKGVDVFRFLIEEAYSINHR